MSNQYNNSSVYNYLANIASAIRDRLELQTSISAQSFAQYIESIPRALQDLGPLTPTFEVQTFLPSSNYLGIRSFHLAPVDVYSATIPAYDPSKSDIIRYASQGDYSSTASWPACQCIQSFCVNAITPSLFDVIPGHIKKGVEIFGVQGTYGLNTSSINFLPNLESVDVDYYATDVWSDVDAFDTVHIESITSSMISNLYPNIIREGVDILGVIGNYNPYPSISRTVSSRQEMVYPDYNKSGFSQITISVVLSSLTVTPSTVVQVFSIEDAAAYSRVHVRAIDSAIEPNLIPENIKQNVSIFGIEGNYAGDMSVLSNCINNIFPSELVADTSIVRSGACMNCLDITTVTLPQCLTIQIDAFANCTNLSQLTIPKCTYLYGLNNCSAITFIDLSQASSVTQVGATTPWFSNAQLKIRIPKSLYTAFLVTSPWNTLGASHFLSV